MFDKRCRTESGCDYIRFYQGKNVVGEPKYHGRSGGVWAGVGTTSPLVVKGSSVEARFHSDGSNNDWGYHFTGYQPLCLIRTYVIFTNHSETSHISRTVSPVAPSLSTLCTPLCAVISTILLQNVEIHSSDAVDPNSDCDCFLAEHLQLIRNGSLFAEGQSPGVLSALNFLYDFEVLESNRVYSFMQPHLSRVASSMFSQFLAFCQQPSEFEKSLLLCTRSLDVCTKPLLSKSTGIKNSAVKTDSSENAFSVEEIEASSNLVQSVTASSSSGAINSLLSSNWDATWTSDGQQGSHWICIQLVDGICAKDVGICVQNSDGSWCPKVITVRAAQNMASLKAQTKVQLDYTSRVSRGGNLYLKALEDNAGMYFTCSLFLSCICLE